MVRALYGQMYVVLAHSIVAYAQRAVQFAVISFAMHQDDASNAIFLRFAYASTCLPKLQTLNLDGISTWAEAGLQAKLGKLCAKSNSIKAFRLLCAKL